MAWFEQLKIHLRDLYLNSSSHAIEAFKPAFHSFFGEEHQTFRLKMFHNLDQLRLQLERENLLEVNPRTCLKALRTQFKEYFASKGGTNMDTLDIKQQFRTYITHAVVQISDCLNDKCHLLMIPTRKLFDSCTSKVDSEPLNGSNDDITNPYECNQTLNISAGTLNLSAGSRATKSVSPTTYVPPSKRDYEILFQPLFDEYFNPPPCVVSPDPVAVAASRPVDPVGSPLSTTIDQDVPPTSTSPTNKEIQFQVTHQDLSSEETTFSIKFASS
ncbi:hypothetical protein Tco_1504059 [Tanacetum coccineum]